VRTPFRNALVLVIAIIAAAASAMVSGRPTAIATPAAHAGAR
jgi:hypothetical protein